MYVVLFVALLLLSVWILSRGVRARSTGSIVAGCLLGVATFGFFGLLDFWGEMLWFGSLGYGGRFWTVVGAKVLTALVAGIVVAGGVALLVRPLGGRGRVATIGAPVVGLLIGAVIGADAWEEILLFLHRAGTGVEDPVLGRDVGFYLFVLPFLRTLVSLLLVIGLVGLATALLSSVRSTRQRIELRASGEIPLATFVASGAVLAVAIASGRLLAIPGLLTSSWGVVTGPGWADMHVRLPALLFVAAVTLLLGLGALASGPRRRVAEWRLPGTPHVDRRGGGGAEGSAEGSDSGSDSGNGNAVSDDTGQSDPAAGDRRVELRGLAGIWIGIGVIWVLGLAIVPRLVQWLVVEPNEITYEKPYIAHNIEFTRRAFGLHEVEQRQFPAREELTRDTIAANRDLLDEVRLWDWRALDAVYKQFQEIRLYYEFEDVDIDRYRIGDGRRQVMVSARELEIDNLPAQSQTFVNRRFKYTHGYGLTLATVSDFTAQGLPNLLVRDIPPRATAEELEVERPEIYYGELTDEPVVVNSAEAEFDHPSGDANVYTRYEGRGGVRMGDGLQGLWRKFVFGWKLDGTRLLLSGYPRAESRFLFRRQVRERVQTVAPFLEVDEDPYVVLVDGRVYWIVDAYTHASSYPYSEPYSAREVIEYKDGDATRRLTRTTVPALHGANYVRNSVKAVVDAYEGSVDLYVFTPDDPLIRAWDRALPGLLQSRDEMPEGLESHVRYPVDLLLVQGLVNAKYHMQDPEVFYNQEDLWVRATEKYYSEVQPVEPYYVMWEQAGSDEVEFVLILPFTPKNRQVLIGWIAGMCDPPRYGRFLSYQFPKDKRVLGPQQVETKIDQDRFLSGQLTLWDQRGSNVIRGNVLAIPLDETLLYVEPIYLQAETAAYPELRLVAVMHGDDLSYAESFDEALEGLFAEGPAPLAEGAGGGDLAGQAQDLFEEYVRLQGEGRFEEAGRRLTELREVIQRLVDRSEAMPGAGPEGASESTSESSP